MRARHDDVSDEGDPGDVVARMRLRTNDDEARGEEAKTETERTIPGMRPLSSLLLIILVGRRRRWVLQFSFIRFRFCRVISKKEIKQRCWHCWHPSER